MPTRQSGAAPASTHHSAHRSPFPSIFCSSRYQLAYSAGIDAANRAMRAAGRTAWNQDDFQLAAQEMERVYPAKQHAFDEWNESQVSV